MLSKLLAGYNNRQKKASRLLVRLFNTR